MGITATVNAVDVTMVGTSTFGHVLKMLYTIYFITQITQSVANYLYYINLLIFIPY
jgi:hypothetical protein